MHTLKLKEDPYDSEEFKDLDDSEEDEPSTERVNEDNVYDMSSDGEVKFNCRIVRSSLSVEW